jgi:hypothetical protein
MVEIRAGGPHSRPTARGPDVLPLFSFSVFFIIPFPFLFSVFLWIFLF